MKTHKPTVSQLSLKRDLLSTAIQKLIDEMFDYVVFHKIIHIKSILIVLYYGWNTGQQTHLTAKTHTAVQTFAYRLSGYRVTFGLSFT